MRFEQNIPIAESYRDALILFKTDAYRLYGRIISNSEVFRVGFFGRGNRCMRFLFWFRLAQYTEGRFRPLCIRMANHYAEKYGLFIYPETKIGYGLYLGHGFNTIINTSAIIGNNVNLSHGVTIGSNKNKAAVIGNNVYIAPNVCTIENCHIGNGSTIGAGTIVTKDIPNNITAVGSPARLIGESHSEYIGNELPMEIFCNLIK